VKISRTVEGFIYIEHVADQQDEPAKVELFVAITASQDGLSVPIRGEVEPGSAGKSHISNYQRNVLPQFDFKGEQISGDKEARFRAFANQAEAGNVYIVRGAWNERYLSALESLPDWGWDYADSTSLGYNILAGLNKAVGRVRVIEGHKGNGTKPKLIEVDDLEDDLIPIYKHGRLIGYEPMLSEDDLARRCDLIPLYEQGRLVRCDMNMNSLGERRRGISG
jgi:predicted phage terminase large subunit-like protein